MSSLRNHTHTTYLTITTQVQKGCKRKGRMAAAAVDKTVNFRCITEAELREWVDANPGRVNDMDKWGEPPLYEIVRDKGSLSLVMWLVDEKGADVNARYRGKFTPLDVAKALDIITALLDRGADPALVAGHRATPLMKQAGYLKVNIVGLMLQYPRVRATVDMQDLYGNTALHQACGTWRSEYTPERDTIDIIRLLLKAGANPIITNRDGQTPLAYLRQKNRKCYTTITLLEVAEEALKYSLLVKARRLLVASPTDTAAPSYLRRRLEQDQPLPWVVLVAV